jgi:hypothetical protein
MTVVTNVMSAAVIRFFVTLTLPLSSAALPRRPLSRQTRGVDYHVDELDARERHDDSAKAVD